MKTTTKTAAILMSALMIFQLAGCGNAATSPTATNTPTQGGATVTSGATDPTGTETTAEFKIAADETGKYSANGNVYTITAAGEYTVTGKLSDGQIVVKAGSDDKVTIILENASINCSTGAAIKAESADSVTVKSPDGTYNVISETAAASSSDTDDTADAAIYSKPDLKLSGKGSLVITSENNKGIKTKNDLEIKNVTLKVTSSGVALKGNDSVTIESGSITVISKNGDGIKTSNSGKSSSGNQRGIVTISGGQVDIYAAGDGIVAAYSAVIETGDSEPEVNIITGSNSEYTKKAQDSTKGIKSDDTIVISGGKVTIKSASDALHANSGKKLDNGATSTGNVTVNGGTLTVNATDDGIHADGNVTVNGGDVRIETAYEGIEGNVINIAAGNVYVYAKDDGMNASSGSSTPLVNITGGNVEVITPNGDTDAIDSNGNFAMSGGFVLVEAGSSMGGVAGSVDVDGKITVTGGTIVALGGICEVPSTGSVNTYVTNKTTFGAGTYTVSDSSGNTIVSFTTTGSYSSAWIASEAFSLNASYSVVKDGSTLLNWTQSSAIEGSYTSQPGGFGGGKGPGGRR